jgi:predicted nucleotidyltransferase
MPDLEFVDRLRAACSDAPADVLAIYLYGSTARDAADRRSDVDVGLLLRSHKGAMRTDISALTDHLEAASHKTVDLIVLNSSSADLIHRVLRDGILLLDRDRAARIRFEVQARNEYFDLEPVRRAYRGPGANLRAGS